MYLSRVKIDRENRKKMKRLTHLGDFHSWIEKSFPAEIEIGERTRKLWRIDQIGKSVYLLLLSQTKPHKISFEKYAVPESFESKSYQSVLDHVENGKTYYFQLTANPTKSVKNPIDKKERGQVVPLVSVENQLNYLMERSERNGFYLTNNNFTIIERGHRILYRTEKRLNIASATYQGVLSVKDKDVFRKTLINGVGRNKAYGFGLLTIIPQEDGYE